MQKRYVFLILSLFLFSLAYGQTKVTTDTTTKTIFAFGGEINDIFINYVIGLTKKDSPKICFIPAASGDNPYLITYWYELCSKLSVKPSVQRVFVSSSEGSKSFEENLLQMDAIIVGGGNTLNMIAIFKAQGIDTVLAKAYQKGIILAGGSAGSLCWFKHGLSDSRPQKLSIIECLGFINASHCPHFSSEKSRKPLYEEAILNHKLMPGYACDDLAGMLFQNGKFIKAVSLDKDNNVYYISEKNGKIDEKKFEAEIIK